MAKPKTHEAFKNPLTGQMHFRLNGQPVNKETFIATAVTQGVLWHVALFAAGKATGVGYRKAFVLGFVYNVLKNLDTVRVDISDKL